MTELGFEAKRQIESLEKKVYGYKKVIEDLERLNKKRSDAIYNLQKQLKACREKLSPPL
jgi:predicted RNase H-like nuclease (RuvC/YqgF family)